MRKNYTNPVNPNDVYCPSWQVQPGSIHVFDGGEMQNFSIATLMWRNSVNDPFELRVGIRWNGNAENCGQPQSHGYPTWFILPKSVARSYAEYRNEVEMINAVNSTTDKPLITTE